MAKFAKFFIVALWVIKPVNKYSRAQCRHRRDKKHELPVFPDGTLAYIPNGHDKRRATD
jgi:hypothetical protein